MKKIITAIIILATLKASAQDTTYVSKKDTMIVVVKQEQPKVKPGNVILLTVVLSIVSYSIGYLMVSSAR